jgi:hypothetical protein
VALDLDISAQASSVEGDGQVIAARITAGADEW